MMGIDCIIQPHQNAQNVNDYQPHNTTQQLVQDTSNRRLQYDSHYRSL